MVFLLLFAVASIAHADVASTEYVDITVQDKVSTTGEDTQNMAGKYVVTGSFEVPDAPLPSAY